MIKNLNLQVLLTLVISLCILACTKENSFLTEDVEQEKVVSTLEITGIQLENDLLQFETPEVFAKIVQEHANTEDEQLDQWEKSIGFQSMRSVHLAAELEQEQVSSQEEADAFLQKWEGLVRFMEDGTVEPIISTSFTKFLNAKGMFKIGEILYQITEQKTIAILDGDWDKLELAYHLPVDYTDESKGIYIISRKSPTNEVVFREDYKECEEFNPTKDWKIIGEMWVHEDKFPVGNGTYVRVADVEFKATSKKKGWWWIKKPADLSIKGSGTVGDQFGANGTFTVNKFKEDTKKLKHYISRVALGSNDNKQKFQSPTSVEFDSSKADPCTLSE